MTTLQYVGDRPYVEFKVGETTFGFARGTERTGVPQELLDRFTGDNYPQWKVTGLETKDEEKAKKMVEVIEATVVEETPTVVEEVAFDTEWTRVKMVEWMEARGESVSKADTKAILTERADALTSKGDE